MVDVLQVSKAALQYARRIKPVSILNLQRRQLPRRLVSAD